MPAPLNQSGCTNFMAPRRHTRAVGDTHGRSAERVADPQIGLDIDRVILFERDVNRAQGAGDDGRAAFGKGEAGPFPPLGEGAGDHHAARRHLDDPGAETEMGAHPGIVRQPILAAARDVFGKSLSVGRNGP